MRATTLQITVLALVGWGRVDAAKHLGLANLQNRLFQLKSYRAAEDENSSRPGRKRRHEQYFPVESRVPSQESTRLHSLFRIVRAGGDANANTADKSENSSTPNTKASKSSAKKHTKESAPKTSTPKRGTKTTGAGASKRNPSIFPVLNVESPTYQSWTAAALAGDVLNRHPYKSAKKIRDNNNPMTGRIWAKLSDRGTLLLKIPSDDSDGQTTVFELSEFGQSSHNTTISSSKLDASQNNEGSLLSKPTVQIQYIPNPDSHSASKSTSFIPVEGIYGVYNLPCSGPHAVLITESEEIYTSPLSTTQNPESNPLLELRRIKSLEIVPLRSKISQKKGSTSTFDEQMTEEARQLRLLRNSFKEHDFYFTVPRKSGNRKSFTVVQDSTHSLQRSFLDWTSDNRIYSYGDHSRGNLQTRANQHRWWLPYFELENRSNTRQRVVDPRFFWNEQPALALLRPVLSSLNTDKDVSESPFGRLLDQVVPVTSAFVGVERNIKLPFPNPSHKSSHESYDQILISRRSKYRTGTRFTRRGADDTGAVANYAETEQICLVTRSINIDNKEIGDSERRLSEVYSHIQTRGSIPLHWSSPADVKAYRPRVFIGVDPTVQARGLRDHLLGELWWYSSSIAKKPNSNDQEVKLAMVNLIDKHGDQGRLGKTFDAVLLAVLDVYGTSSDQKQKHSATNELLGPKVVKHIWYDFHAQCKGGRWDRLSHLLDEVSPTLTGQAYFCAVPTNTGGSTEDWQVTSLQDGVVRTNCMDCLDRTNVVQSMFGRFMLYRQLHDRVGLSTSAGKRNKRTRSLPLEYVVAYKQKPLSLPWVEGEAAHRHLWADNADAISRLYAGTPALKGDFTRTGVRTKRGALDDGLNSLQRYYLNNFIDSDRQEGMDLLVGSTEFSVDGNADDEMSRVFLLQELANNERRGYNKDHVRIKAKSKQLSNTDGADNSRPKLSLSWLPGDLRHHMKVEALQSRSPLSSAASEEELHNAKKSSDFLMEVSSSAVAPHNSDVNVVSLGVLHSIDRRVASDRPWWAPYNDDMWLDSSENILDSSPNRAFLVTMLLLLKFPIITSAIAVGVIASGFRGGLDTDEE